MTTKTRIYLVETGTETRLVRAANVTQAIRYVAHHTISASVATQDRLIAAIGAGIKVEEPSESEPAAEAAQ